jgi:predicted nucleotidyltransferase
MDRQCLGQAAAAHGVELLVQFGSTVTGVPHLRSDVDLAVLLTHPPESYAREAELQTALQSCVPDREVDLVILNRADPLLLKQVTESGRLLHGDASRWQEFRAYAFKRYQDHRRFLEMEREYVDRAAGSARR